MKRREGEKGERVGGRRKTRKRKRKREGNEKMRRDLKSHFRKGTRIRELERKKTEKKKILL